MKIGFDAKRAAQNKTGLGNYSRFVIDILSANADSNSYLLYIPNPEKAKLLGNLSSKRNISLHFPASSFWKKFCSLWRIWGITSELINDKITLYHGLSNELPLNIGKATEIKSIVTIHDLIFLRYPEYYHHIDREIYTCKFRQACLKADRIIAVSQCTKRDIISFFHIPEEKIDVVYQGCDPQFKEPASLKMKEEVRQKYHLPEKYILYVGSIENRKNLLLLAKALKQTKESIPVIAIGKRTPYADKVEQYLKENKLSDRMRLLSGIPFAELPSFYQMASLFVYPSFFEGFGIPILEALNSGIPVIGATGSCLEEAGGADSIYIPPTDEIALANAIDQVLGDESLRLKMIEAGKKYALLFEDSNLAAHLLDVYNRTINQ